MNKVYLSIVTFVVFSVPGLHAQSPGGVSTNLSMWLKPDALSAGTLNTWTYANNVANSFTAVAGNQPTVVANTFNFLPSVVFAGNQYMSGPAGVNAPLAAGQLAYSIFGVWQSSTAVFGANERVWVQRPNSNAFDGNFDGAALWVYPGNATYGDQPEVSPFTTGVSFANTSVIPYTYGTTYMLTYAPNTPYVSQLNLLNQNTNDLEVMDQTNYATGAFVTSTDPNANATVDRVLSNGANLLGARSTSIDEPFIGNLSELVVYSGSVSGLARQQVFSYLSLKYGIPLGGNYISSGGATIWDAVNFSAYNNFVFGIGTDNASGLAITQSNSSATGTGSGAGQSGKGNIVLSNPSSMPDQSFIMVGSNNAGLTETTTNLPPAATAGSERLVTQWLVRSSGTPGTVTVSFDFTGLTVTGVPGTIADFRLMLDNDGDGNFSTGYVSLIQPSSFTGNVANFTNVNLSSNPNVVMAIMSNAGAGTPLPVNFVNVTAQPNGADVDLSWTVGANEQAKDYQVQQSIDGVSFSTIGDVANVLNQTSYSFVQSNAGAGTHYYRILETDNDGAYVYSKVVSANLSASEFSIRTLNNPVTSSSQNAEIEMTALSGGNASLEIWTLGGTRVATLMQTVAAGTTRISLPLTNVAPGTYAVKIRVNEITHVLQIVKL
jgi:hypothetical protein